MTKLFRNSAAALLGCTLTAAAAIEVDADYPGGNIAVERREGDAIYLHQELRDTQGWWFYWNFRVRGAAGKKITFCFSGRPPFDRQGPAISRDGGLSWSWLGTASVKGSTFSHAFGADDNEIRFAFALPYLEADLNRFLMRHQTNRALTVQELCRTRKGRSVEQLRLGNPGGTPLHRVLLTARTHACESSASYALEGMLAAVLGESAEGEWFRQNVELLVIPFMDKDGVEAGDQGKNRKPHDHNRDFDSALYPSVAALRRLVPQWSEGRLTAAFDLHSPYLRDNKIFLVGSSDSRTWEEQCRFGAMLEGIADKPLPYTTSGNIPFGQSWNTGENYKQGKSCSRWAAELPGIRLVSAIEFPYGSVGEHAVTPENLRAFGGTLIQALHRYLTQSAQ